MNTLKHDITQADIKYAKYIAHRLYPHIERSSALFAELESAAMLGLVDAANKYNADKANKNWRLYRYYRVSGSIKDAMRVEAGQGGVGITGRGRCDTDDGIKLEDTTELIIDERMNPEELCIMKECYEIALDYIMTCKDETAVKLVAVILAGAKPADVARKLKCLKVDTLVKYHKPLMLQYIRERMGIDSSEITEED